MWIYFKIFIHLPIAIAMGTQNDIEKSTQREINYCLKGGNKRKQKEKEQ